MKTLYDRINRDRETLGIKNIEIGYRPEQEANAVKSDDCPYVWVDWARGPQMIQESFGGTIKQNQATARCNLLVSFNFAVSDTRKGENIYYSEHNQDGFLDFLEKLLDTINKNDSDLPDPQLDANAEESILASVSWNRRGNIFECDITLPAMVGAFYIHNREGA